MQQRKIFILSVLLLFVWKGQPIFIRILPNKTMT